MDPEVHRVIFSAQIQQKYSKTDCKMAKIKLQKQPKSFSRQRNQPNRAAFELLNTKVNAERPKNKQLLKVAAVKACRRISGEEKEHLVMPVSSRLH